VETEVLERSQLSYASPSIAGASSALPRDTRMPRIERRGGRSRYSLVVLSSPTLSVFLVRLYVPRAVRSSGVIRSVKV